MTREDIFKTVDHTLLAQTATWEEIKEICDVGYKDFHLCPKCRKKFEEWMKNERHNIVHQ